MRGGREKKSKKNLWQELKRKNWEVTLYVLKIVSLSDPD